MSVAFGARFTIGVIAKVLEYARLTESVEALVYCVGVSVESRTQRTLQKHVQITLLHIFYQPLLCLKWILLHRWLLFLGIVGVHFIFFIL